MCSVFWFVDTHVWSEINAQETSLKFSKCFCVCLGRVQWIDNAGAGSGLSRPPPEGVRGAVRGGGQWRRGRGAARGDSPRQGPTRREDFHLRHLVDGLLCACTLSRLVVSWVLSAPAASTAPASRLQASAPACTPRQPSSSPHNPGQPSAALRHRHHQQPRVPDDDDHVQDEVQHGDPGRGPGRDGRPVQREYGRGGALPAHQAVRQRAAGPPRPPHQGAAGRERRRAPGAPCLRPAGVLQAGGSVPRPARRQAGRRGARPCRRARGRPASGGRGQAPPRQLGAALTGRPSGGASSSASPHADARH